QVAEELNNRPRKSLGFRTPAEVMAQQIMQLNSGVALQI
ncbi:MAG: IS30 family transposase, partial [Acidithiobacillus sp.]|nr:IS30 family transposase [Acidithiobacillus sp.]